MRLRFIFLLLALCSSISCALAQEVLVVPLIDKTGAGSPFEVSGRLLLKEVVRANQLEWSWGQKVTVRNISGRPILLFVATLTEIGRHPLGRKAAPGDGPTYELDDDRFFSDDLIRPGESVTLRDTEPGTPDVACCINPLEEKRDPTAEYHLRFVQFADGSTFGDPAEARDALAIRSMISSGLRELLSAYTELGTPGFAARLREQSPFSATALCREILAKYREAGIQVALGRTEQILATAQRHSAMMTGAATASQTLSPRK